MNGGGDKVFGLVSFSISLFVFVSRFYSSSSKDKQNKKSEQEEEEQVQLEEEEEEQVQLEEEQQIELEEEVIINVPWSELDWDVLGEIVSRLCLTDQARFIAVCKNWLAAAVHPITATSSSSSSSSLLPWHGCIIPGSHQFQIFDPLSSAPNHPASIQNIFSIYIQNIWSNLGIQSPPSTVGILDIQHNWLFLFFQKPRLFFRTQRYPLLFSPLTKKVITLPEFDLLGHGTRFAATFSTQPDSPDCVYCIIDADSIDKISVITYRNGDKGWNARQFSKVPGPRGFAPCGYYPLILDGIIYLINAFGQVASYNILNGEFNFDCSYVDALLLQNVRSRRMFRVFVLNEEPMILYYDPEGKKDVPGNQCIKRYDRSRKVWIPATTLLGYTLFFSHKICNVWLINTKGRTYNGVLSNKIYHFVNGGCRVYSLNNGNLVQFESINSNLLEDDGGELLEYKYNYDIPDADVILAYFLKPPCVRSSSHNQGNYERAMCKGGEDMMIEGK